MACLTHLALDRVAEVSIQLHVWYIAMHKNCLVSFLTFTSSILKFSQISKSSFAHCRGDGLDGSEQRVEQHGEGASGRSNLSLFVENEPSERHGVHAHLVDWQRGSR